MKMKKLRKRVPASIRELLFYTEDVRKNEKRTRKLIDKDYPTYIAAVPTGPMGYPQLRVVDTTPQWVQERRNQTAADAAREEWVLSLSERDSATVQAALDAEPAAPTEAFVRAAQQYKDMKNG